MDYIKFFNFYEKAFQDEEYSKILKLFKKSLNNYESLTRKLDGLQNKLLRIIIEKENKNEIEFICD